MLNKIKLLCLGLITFGTISIANATLINDQVNCSVEPSIFWVCSAPMYTVGMGSEFSLLLFGNEYFQIDISQSSISVNFTNSNRLDTGAGELLRLSDLDWTDYPLGRIIGIENFLTSGTTDISAGDVNFTDHSVSFDFNNATWTEGVSAFAQWDLIVEHAQVPTASTIALFGLGLAGLGFARRKKA